MRLINTRVHGWLDYIVGGLFILVPWLLGFAEGGAETWVFVALGVVSIVYALLTDYELGVVRVIPMHVHLWIDAVIGFALLVSPWVFNFAGEVWLPHVTLGALALLLSVTTQTQPGYAARREAARRRAA
jgi:hypothetical protein